MKSSLALLTTTVAVGATVTSTQWVTEVVTVTVTVDPTGPIPTPQSTSTRAPDPIATSVVVSPSAPAQPPPNSFVVEEPKPTTTVIQAPPPTSTPEPVATTQPMETSQAPQSSSAPSGYQGTAIKYHNAYRENHSAGNLEWSDTLAQYAYNTAKKCVFAHDMDQGDANYGQNLASFGTTGDLGASESALAAAIETQWYKEEVDNYKFYGQADPPPGADFNSFGHFSQLVWKDSTQTGCATVTCDAGTVLSYPAYFTVCNYSPPGNFQGRYATNVLPSLGLKIDL